MSREILRADLTDRHPGTKHIMQYFEFDHLPPHLQNISALCAELAHKMVMNLADGPELSAGLRKLLEAKDAFVRAALDISKNKG